MKPAAIISFNKIITTLGKQSWLGFEHSGPLCRGVSQESFKPVYVRQEELHREL